MRLAARFVILAFLAALWNRPGAALPPLGENFLKSVVLIESAGTKTCATGFFLSQGNLITNAHVVKALCPFGDCSQIRLLYSDGLGKPPAAKLNITKLRVENMNEALDLAVLAVSWPEGTAAPALQTVEKAGAAVSGSKLFVLGFPRCRALELSSGIILESGPLFFTASARGAHGSSGSPVFDDNLSLLGIVSQSSSLSSALASLAAGGGFGIKAQAALLFEQTQAPNEAANLRLMAEALFNHYRNYVQPRRGMVRALAGFNFMASAEGLKRYALSRRELRAFAPQFSAFGEYVSILPSLAGSLERTAPAAAALAVERLALAYNLERRGPYYSVLRRLDLGEFEKALTHSEMTAERKTPIMELVAAALNSRYPGAELYSIKLGLLAAVLALALAVPWAYSLGIVFECAGGGVFRRFIVSAAVGLLFWPLSFVIFMRQSRAQARIESLYQPASRRQRG